MGDLAAVEQKRNLGEISAEQEIRALASLEQGRYELERAALERRITELPEQELQARERLYSQLQALDDRHYAMDFRLVHPWFGQTFRYAGRFQVDPSAQAAVASSDAAQA